MKSTALKLVLTLLLSFTNLKADREPLRSIVEMEMRSPLVIDGKVIKIEAGETEEIPVPNAAPVVRTKYKALFQIDEVVKISKDDKIMLGSTVDLIYKITLDSRFRGEPSLNLSVGKKFRLYAGVTAKQESGKISIFIHSSNEVRPEAYKGNNLINEVANPANINRGQEPENSTVLPTTPVPVASNQLEQADSKLADVLSASSSVPATVPTGFSFVQLAIIGTIILVIILFIFRHKNKPR